MLTLSSPASSKVVIRPQVWRQPRVSRFGKVFLFVLLLAIFEGSARKWISNSLSLPLVMTRDLAVVYGIYYAMRHAGFTFERLEVKVLTFWTLAVVAWGLLQVVAGKLSLPVLAIAMHFWLLYLWFAIAASTVLSEHDVRVICRTMLVLMVLMTPLVVLQQMQPTGSFINRQVDGDEDRVFTVVPGLVRATGTFSFTLGFAMFLACAAPIALAYIVSKPAGRERRGIRSLIVLGCLVVSTLSSGSRASVIELPILFSIAAGVTLLFGRGATRRKAITWTTVMALLVLATVTIFASSVKGMMERFSDASGSEDFEARIGSMFLGESDAYAKQSFLGAGLGRGSNLAAYMETGAVEGFMLVETETGRSIAEGGAIGYVFVMLKLLVCATGFWRALRIARRTGDSFAMLLWTVATICLMSWPLIGQLTANVLGFLFVGFTMAVTRLRGKARSRR